MSGVFIQILINHILDLFTSNNLEEMASARQSWIASGACKQKQTAASRAKTARPNRA